MKGVLGLLLILVGLEVAYLVLAGKLPLKLQTKGGTGGGPNDTASPDIRQLVYYGTHRTRPYTGIPLPHWEGLLN